MDTTIKLGGFSFQDFEVPEKINFGGQQRLIQHNLIGGGRIIDALGKDDIDISWSGLMMGPDALTRAQTLNLMRVSGQQLTLTWFSLNYTVVILNFVSYTERFYQVSYEISLRVINDGANPTGVQTITGFDQAIQGDYNTAALIAANLNNTNINASMLDLTDAISGIQTFNGLPPAEVNTLTNTISSVISVVQSQITPVANRLYGTNQ